MKKMKKNNGSVIKVWFSTYIVILIIPLMVNYFLFVHSKNIISEEIENSRETLVSRLKNDIDEELFSMKQIAVIVGQDSKTLKMISDDRKGILENNKYDVIEYLDYIRTITASVRGMSVLLQLSESDRVVFNHTYSAGDFFAENYLSRESFPDYEDWTNLIEDKYKNDYFSLDVESAMTVENHYIVYASSLPFGSFKNSTSTLLTMIEKSRISDLLEEYMLSEDGLVFILDESNNVILTTDESIGIEGLDYAELNAEKYSYEAVRNGNDVVLIVEQSDHVPWKYVVVSEKEVYLEKNTRYNQVVVISVAVYVLIGLILAAWFTRRNYKPIGQMVQLVSDHADDIETGSGGDYDYLTSAFEEAFFKMDALENKISEQNNVMRNNFLFRLLSGIVQDQDMINESIAKYGFKFSKDCYSTVILNVDLQSGSEGSKVMTTYIKIAEFFKAIPVLERDSYYIIRGSYIIFVVNSEREHQEALKEILFAMMDQLKQEMNALMTIDISVGISDVHDSINGLSEAYIESMNCLEYALMYEPGEILSNRDIVSRGAYYYPLTAEQKLINYMKTGEAQKAEDTLKEIYAKNFDENRIGINMGRNLLFDISSSMLKAIDTAAMSEMNISSDIVHAVTFTKRIEETKAKLMTFLLEVCEYYKQQQKDIEKTSYLKTVNTYIENHYKNSDLNISLIADQFNLTPSYLSKLYKAESGDSILSYINKVRVKEAKKLLAESDLTNREIATSVGILNDTSFNRVFKGLEGITPGQFRKNIQH